MQLLSPTRIDLWDDLHRKVFRWFCKHWAPFLPVFSGSFPRFSGILWRFSRILPRFPGTLPRFSTKQNFRGALAPPPPTPLDLPLSSNLLFNFSKQASTVVASKFHKRHSTFHLFRFLFHDAIFTTRVSRGLFHLNKIVTSVPMQMAWLLVILCYFLTPSDLNDAYMRHTFKRTGCGTTHICVIQTPTR